jgi:hypothetical protein
MSLASLVPVAVRLLPRVAPAVLLAGAAAAQTTAPAAPAPPRLDTLAPSVQPQQAALPATAAVAASAVAPVSAADRPCSAIGTETPAVRRRPITTAVPTPPVRIVERLDGGAATDGGGAASAVECLVTVDGDGTRIEELRVGGTTRRMVVHPKDGNRPYEIQLLDAGRDTAAKSGPGRGGAGQRVWPVLAF